MSQRQREVAIAKNRRMATTCGAHAYNELDTVPTVGAAVLNMSTFGNFFDLAIILFSV